MVGVLVDIYAGLHHVQLIRHLNRGEMGHSRPAIQAVAVAFFLALIDGLAVAAYLISLR